jgi:Zn-dependent peptidase ImmA (M78 family)/transcriptional regulator with XRE-family HTH domain
MSEEFFGARLQSLRHLNGLTQREMGNRLGITQSNLSRFERGTVPLPDHLAAAASAAFGEPLSFFQVSTTDEPAGPLAFRKKSTMKAAQRDRVDILYREASRVFALVSAKSSYVEFDARQAEESTPEKVATLLRALAGLGVTEPVRNVTRLLERLGVGVVADLDEDVPDLELKDVSGITMPSRNNKRPLIATMSINRGDVQRLTIAHELGHLVLDRNAATVSCSSRSPQERAAFSVGASLLAPPEVMRKRVNEASTLRVYMELKAEYGISIGALVFHAHRLGLISNERYRTLQIQMVSRGWRDTEPVEVVIEKPALFHQALSKIYPTGTYARASHDLGVAPSRLRRWSASEGMEVPLGNVTTLRPR